MKIAFYVNEIATERAGYTTTRLGMAAVNRGHEVYVIGAEDFSQKIDGSIHARARKAVKTKYVSTSSYLSDLQKNPKARVAISVDELEVLLLRSDPSTETGPRAWAETTGIEFGRAAAERGVIVLNDPNALMRAMNKLYLQLFPAIIRPRTLITRDIREVRHFLNEEGKIVIKPLQGSGGRGVFLVDKNSSRNLNQMIEFLDRDGFVIAQEYLTAAIDGDMRLFVMNGEPLAYKGHYAAFRRVRRGEDMRSNIHAGGKLGSASVTEKHLEMIDIVRPKLAMDGMFLVGLDIVGEKLMEINVFSPGGLGSAQKFEGVNFSVAVIQALERKAKYAKDYMRDIENRRIASL
jgi:glutathione synthase